MATRHDSAQGHASDRRHLSSGTERILMQMDQFQAAFLACACELDRAVDRLREQTAANTIAIQSYPYRKTTLLIQLLSVAMFTSFADSMIAKFAKTCDDAMTHTAREFIFELEMYPRALCAIPKGSHVAFVADEKIMTAERAASGNGITFDQPRDCKAGS